MENIVRIGFKDGTNIDINLGNLAVNVFIKDIIGRMRGTSLSHPQLYCLNHDFMILFNEVLYIVPLSFDGSVGIVVEE